MSETERVLEMGDGSTGRSGSMSRRPRRGFGAVGLLGAAALVSVVVLAGCGSDSDGSASKTTTSKAQATTTAPAGSVDAASLDGKAFTSTSVTGYELVKGTEISLAFEDGRMSANAGCNSMSGEYAVTDGELAWTGPAMATMMGCPDDLQAQDTWLTGLLTDGMKEALDGDTLTLTSGDVTIELAAAKASPVVGTAWTLESTVANDAVSSLPAGAKPPTLEIGKDGAASIFTGCNNGSTDVTIDGDTMTWGPIAMTRMFCQGPPGDLETAVTTVLDGKTTFVVDGSTLTITKGDQGLVYVAAP